MIEIYLETGRKHQIRVQFAGRGFPVLGDIKYGAKTTFPNGIALHAWKLTVAHPISKQPLELSAPLPKSFPQFAEKRK